MITLSGFFAALREVVFWLRISWLENLYFAALQWALQRRWFYGSIIVHHPITGQSCAQVALAALVPERVDGYRVDYGTDLSLEYTWSKPQAWRSGKVKLTGRKQIAGNSCIYFKDEVKDASLDEAGRQFFVETVEPLLDDNTERLYLVFTGFKGSPNFLIEFFGALVPHIACKKSPLAILVEESGDAAATLKAMSEGSDKVHFPDAAE